jgi:hypothetical protein
MAVKKPANAAPALGTRNPATKQHALKGIEAIDAKLRARLLELNRTAAKRKSFDQKIAAANIQVYRQSGVNIGALTAAGRQTMSWR